MLRKAACFVGRSPRPLRSEEGLEGWWGQVHVLGNCNRFNELVTQTERIELPQVGVVRGMKALHFIFPEQMSEAAAGFGADFMALRFYVLEQDAQSLTQRLMSDLQANPLGAIWTRTGACESARKQDEEKESYCT